MEDLTLISCSYNTPDVTMTMLRSFFKHHDETSVLIIDNSTNNDTATLLQQNNVRFIRNNAGLHINSVDVLLKNINTTYALLVDTDVIFLKSQQTIFDKFKLNNLTLLGEVCGDRGGKKIHFRVHPWYCFINVNNIKNNNISFFNRDRHFRKDGKIYDVGCTFYQDIKERGLLIGDIRLEGKYFKHYEGMSWRVNRYGDRDGDIDLDNTATHNNIHLYNYGRLIEKEYSKEIELHKDVKLKCKYL